VVFLDRASTHGFSSVGAGGRSGDRGRAGVSIY
jgi:hypothetical protein